VRFSIVGCGQRAECESRCAGAEIREQSWQLRSPTVARAGTPDLEFAPLVTPYKELTAANLIVSASLSLASGVVRVLTG
jgi:hypothetical protein